jgi:arylsulfatase A-like enzyme
MMTSRFVCLALSICVLLAAATSRAAETAPQTKPNVIFILSDDLGYGDLGCYGQTKIKTPNIDQLAREGMRFTQCYAGNPVCAPSRCTLMTGKHTGHAPIRGNKEVQPEGQPPMPPDTFTVAKLMKNAGYATGIVGKWGLGPPGSESTPNKMGFDFFYGYICQRKAHFYHPEYLWRNDEKVMLGGKKYSHDLMAGEALNFVRENKSKPFFLYLAFTIPHFSLEVPEDSLAEYRGKFPEPRAFDDGHYTRQPEPRTAYAAMITRMDRDVGRLMALLKELGLDDNTLVFFTSDNGMTFLAKDLLADFFNSTGGLRGLKGEVYEGGIRTPMVARWPGKIKAGATNDQVWAFWDFLPTMAELVGAKPPADIDGVSVLPTLLAQKSIEHPPLYWEFHERGFHQAVRMDDWKGVRHGTQKPVELYDLKSDLAEKNDVVADHPDIVSKIEAIFEHGRTDSELFPIREKPAGKPAAAAPAQQK